MLLSIIVVDVAECPAARQAMSCFGPNEWIFTFADTIGNNADLKDKSLTYHTPWNLHLCDQLALSVWAELVCN
jgi:hypothetical protein